MTSLQLRIPGEREDLIFDKSRDVAARHAVVWVRTPGGERIAELPEHRGELVGARGPDREILGLLLKEYFVHAKRTKFSVWSTQTDNPRRVVNDALRLFGIFSLN